MFRHSHSEVDQTPSQTLLLKAAEVIHDKLTEIDTLDRYAIQRFFAVLRVKKRRFGANDLLFSCSNVTLTIIFYQATNS